MHALSASVILSSIALGSQVSMAQVQSVDPGTLSELDAAAAEASPGYEDLPPGLIPQPSIDLPGLVMGVTLGELYTDNLRLAADGAPKKSSWITEVQPFIKSAISNPRFSGVLDYRLTGYLYMGQVSEHQLAHDLDAKGTVTILPQHLFLDGTAGYSREIINNQLAGGSGRFFLNNNQTNIAIGTLSPYWLQDLGRVGSMMLRYTRGRVAYNDNGIPQQDSELLRGIPDVTSDTVQFDLASPEGNTWGWNLGYADQRLNPDFGPNQEFARGRLGISLQVNPELRLLADGGKEDEYLPDGTVKNLGASFWDVGFAWSNSRNNFRAMTGHRFYGRSYQLSWIHHAALLTTSVSYVQQPTSYNQQLLNPYFGTGMTAPVSVRTWIPSLTELQPYLSKRWTGIVAYTMARSTLRVTAYDESRTYFLRGEGRERVANAGVSWLFDLGPLTTLTPSFHWQRYRFRTGQVNYTRYAQLSLVHQLNAKNFASLRLRRDARTVHSAVPSAHGYDANVVFLQLTHLF